LDQLPTVWQSEIAKTVEYKFVECGLEVYYNKAVLDEFYIIIQGSVRLILEPTNTTYCRTVDLTDKDTFAEQVITKPGTQMQSQAVALEDTHLMVVKRSAVEAVINRGKKTRQGPLASYKTAGRQVPTYLWVGSCGAKCPGHQTGDGKHHQLRILPKHIPVPSHGALRKSNVPRRGTGKAFL